MITRILIALTTRHCVASVKYNIALGQVFSFLLNDFVIIPDSTKYQLSHFIFNKYVVFHVKQSKIKIQNMSDNSLKTILQLQWFPVSREQLRVDRFL